MEELDLFDEHVTVRARGTDPETSKAAAAAFEANQKKAQRCVTTVVALLMSEGDLTDFEIREKWPAYWGDDHWSFTLPCKARHWARQAGLVKHVGFGIHEGRKVRKWGLGNDMEAVTSESKCPTCGRAWKQTRSKTSNTPQTDAASR